MASWKGHLDVVKTLIEAGANIHQADKVSQLHTYLHVYDIIACDQCACDPSHTLCRKRCVKGWWMMGVITSIFYCNFPQQQ